MKIWLLILIPLCSGCASFVKELHKPPYPLAVAQHSRVVGIKISYQGVGLQLGFVSESVTLIPTSTNELFTAPISDEFVLGQHALDTSIKERIITGYKGTPPPPLMKIFSPKDQSRQGSAHGAAFAQKQALAVPERPKAASVGALDSFAPVFALRFNETDRRPIAVLELNADDAFNTYKVVGAISYSDTNSPPMPPK